MEPLCTITDLLGIIVAPSLGLYMLPSQAHNEVYPNVFVGEMSTAMNIHELKEMGITHVLNAAQGPDRFSHVDTTAEFYEQHGIEFLGIPAVDRLSFQIELYFEEAANFIDKATELGGKVLVHCRGGVSRSATLTLAYLMIKKDMTVQEAMKTVRSQREVIPNNGFLQQLCNLNEKLQRRKELESSTK